jgi:glyoxalase family protein
MVAAMITKRRHRLLSFMQTRLSPADGWPAKTQIDGNAGENRPATAKEPVMPHSSGIHHITAIARDARANVAFYTDVLGLRMVKKTVNYDDPGTYHLYYGDEDGHPGTILTFFPWAGMPLARRGAGETGETAFVIPQGAVSFWLGRLSTLNIPHDVPEKRFGETRIALRDPDNMRLVLVAREGAEALPGRAAAGIDAASSIRGFAGATLVLRTPEATAQVLETAFGWLKTGEEGRFIRYAAPGDAAIGNHIDLEQAGDLGRAGMGPGSVHHIAFRAADDAAQAEMAAALHGIGVQTTEQKQRNYFRSVYFREPGGVIFEIATDDPGFANDETPETLGQKLLLPPWLEAERGRIEAALPALDH